MPLKKRHDGSEKGLVDEWRVKFGEEFASVCRMDRKFIGKRVTENGWLCCSLAQERFNAAGEVKEEGQFNAGIDPLAEEVGLGV